MRLHCHEEGTPDRSWACIPHDNGYACVVFVDNVFKMNEAPLLHYVFSIWRVTCLIGMRLTLENKHAFTLP